MSELILLIIAVTVSTISLAFSLHSYLSVRRIKRVLEGLRTSRSLKRLIKLTKERRRLRNRYIIFRVIPLETSSKINEDLLKNEVMNKFKEIFGAVNLRYAGIDIVYYDKEKLIGVFRVKHLFKLQLLAVLGLVKNISGSKIIILPIRTAGTVKKAKKYIRSIVKS